jgi:hypothetical protein
MSDSNYVLAGFETLATYFKNFSIRNLQNNWNDNFTPEILSTFLSQTSHGFLHSFGQNFTGKKKYGGYVAAEAKLFRDCRAFGIFDHCNFIADSGGFQASIGRIDEHETDNLVNLYHDFLENEHDCIDKAFILDLPPGPGCKLFKTFDDIYYANERTYNLAKNLPKEARDKVIYIHHFRTPKLWDIYTDLLNSDGMFDAFTHFGTGGIVANSGSDTAIPCIIYVLPLIPVLKKAKEAGRKEIDFHILGGANFRDIFFYEMFSKIVKETHDIELRISYDSSGVFKGLMRGRTMYILDDENIVRKIDVRSACLDKRYHPFTNTSTNDIIKDKIEYMSDRFNLKHLDPFTIYDKESGTFPDDFRMYAAMLVLRTFADVQLLLRRKAYEIYPVFQSGDLEEFNKQCGMVTQNVNQGKITRKQKAKTNSLVNSLKMLINLDEDYCKYIVNKHLAKDEFAELNPATRIITV